MNEHSRNALASRVAARYRTCGRFARHYVAGKLRWDPMFAALLDEGERQTFGTVADLGCGRGQFAALLLEAGLAERAIGLDENAALLADARRAMATLAFDGIKRDLAVDPVVPDADTVLMLDVLYQLPTEAQARLLAAAASAAGRMMLVRTADPSPGVRSWATALLEHAGRPIWPHAGGRVNARPVSWIVGQMEQAGFSVDVSACRAGTPFSNVLLRARRKQASTVAFRPPAIAPPGITFYAAGWRSEPASL